jgi:hypothetical protein
MSAKAETFYVAKSDRGWVVKADSSRGQLGPYSDRERATLMAIAFAKDNRPSQVKVQNSLGGWWLEKTFEELDSSQRPALLPKGRSPGQPI